MFVTIRMVARRVRTAATFTASDPWNGGRATAFSVEAYRMLPERLRDPRQWREGTLHTWGTRERYGIRSEIDGVERMLPTFLAELYAARAVPVEQLPGLLHRFEPELSPRDHRFLPGRWVRRVALVSLALYAVAMGAYYLGIAVVLSARSPGASAGAPTAASSDGPSVLMLGAWTLVTFLPAVLAITMGGVWLLFTRQRRRNRTLARRALATARQGRP